jgi:hypothetical protein
MPWWMTRSFRTTQRSECMRIILIEKMKSAQTHKHPNIYVLPDVKVKQHLPFHHVPVNWLHHVTVFVIVCHILPWWHHVIHVRTERHHACMPLPDLAVSCIVSSWTIDSWILWAERDRSMNTGSVIYLLASFQVIYSQINIKCSFAFLASVSLVLFRWLLRNEWVGEIVCHCHHRNNRCNAQSQTLGNITRTLSSNQPPL